MHWLILCLIALYSHAIQAEEAQIKLDSCQLWLDGQDQSTIVAHPSGEITSWKDKSGHGYEAKHITGSNPTLNSNGINGKQGIDFSASDYQFFRIKRMPFTDNMTVFIVSKQTPNHSNSGAAALLFWDGLEDKSHSSIMAIHAFKGKYHMVHSPIKGKEVLGVSSTRRVTDHMNHAHIITAYRDDANKTLSIQINDREPELTKNDHVGVKCSEKAMLNIGTAKIMKNRYFQGVIGEIIIYNKILSDKETATVKNYLKKRWAINE